MFEGHLLPDGLLPLPVACLGPATAETARALGLQVELVAQEYTIDGLLAALVRWHTRRNGW